MTQHTLEEYFQIHDGIAIDFLITVENRNTGWAFYIHPQNANGETWEFQISGNQLNCIMPSSEASEEPDLPLMIQQLDAKISDFMQTSSTRHSELLNKLDELQPNSEE